MKVEIRIPKMGESIVKATIGAILKSSGDFVREGEDILEIETEKVNQVLSAPISGKLDLLVASQDEVVIDQIVATIEKGKDDAPNEEPLKEEKKKREGISEKETKKEGAIRKSVEESLEELHALPPSPIEPLSSRTTRKKMSRIRQVIAKRLVQAKNETAMLTTFNEVDMSQVLKIREDNQESFQKKFGVKLGLMSFFIKACVHALQEIPEINASIEEEEILFYHFYDIGVAVSTEKGLFVPVLRNADQMSFADMEKTLKAYAEKARAGLISIEEMQGGTFTITNGGVFGSMLSTPILNPPQSAILGMHNIVKRAVVVGEKIEIRPMMYLALSYDHRIVDGKEAISFLTHIKKHLEEPARFLLDL